MFNLEGVLPALEALIKELRILNEHLSDFKEMAAPYLGFRIIEKKKE